MKRLWHPFAPAALLTGFCIVWGISCRSETQPLPRSRPVRRIALVGVGKDHPTWPILQVAALQVAGRRGRLHIQALAPDVASPRGQQEILESLIGGDQEAVCIHPLDPAALAPTIADLVRRGIPVVTLGCDVPNSGRNCYCGPLESDIGRAAAQACQSLTKYHSSSIMLLHAGADDVIYGARYSAFKAQLAAMSNVHLLRELDCQRNRLDSVKLVKSESRKYPRVAGWVLLDDWPLRLMAANERLFPEGCGIILCNADPRYNQQLRDGRIQAMIGYDVREAVQQALYAAVRLGDDSLKKAFAPEIITVAPEIITIDDLSLWEARWKAWQTGQPSPTSARAVNSP